MFLHSLKYSFKILVRDKQTVFWTTIFTIILAVFFKLALGGLDDATKFEQISISINSKIKKADPYFKQFIEKMEEEKYLKIVKETNSYNEDKEEINKLFQNDEITVHIEAEEEIIVGENNGTLKETVIKVILDSYIQNKSMIMNILKENPKANIAEILEIETFIDDKSNENMSIVNTYFYTLIGMQALYSYIWGLRVMYLYQANLSTIGKRNSVAPINKILSVFASLVTALLLSLLSMTIVILFVYKILNINMGDKFLHIILIVLLGAFTGVSFGAFMAVSNKKSIEFKNGLGIGITMLWSFMAGMMVSNMKILIQRDMPILNKLNPVALITDGMYSLYYYQNIDRYLENIAWLSGIAIFFVIGTIFFMRGKKYDSL